MITDCFWGRLLSDNDNDEIYILSEIFCIIIFGEISDNLIKNYKLQAYS